MFKKWWNWNFLCDGLELNFRDRIKVFDSSGPIFQNHKENYFAFCQRKIGEYSWIAQKKNYFSFKPEPFKLYSGSFLKVKNVQEIIIKLDTLKVTISNRMH